MHNKSNQLLISVYWKCNHLEWPFTSTFISWCISFSVCLMARHEKRPQDELKNPNEGLE